MKKNEKNLKKWAKKWGWFFSLLFQKMYFAALLRKKPFTFFFSWMDVLCGVCYPSIHARARPNTSPPQRGSYLRAEVGSELGLRGGWGWKRGKAWNRCLAYCGAGRGFWGKGSVRT